MGSLRSPCRESIPYKFRPQIIEQEQSKENQQRPPVKDSSVDAASSSSSWSLGELDSLREQQPFIIPPPTWAIPNVPSSSTVVNTTSTVHSMAATGVLADTIAKPIMGFQTGVTSEPNPILRSASLTNILDELNEKAESRRGLGVGGTLVKIDGSSSDQIDVNDDISSIVVGEAGSVEPSPLAEAHIIPLISGAEPMNSTLTPHSSHEHTTLSSSSS